MYWDKQIAYVLIVDFEIGDSDVVGDIGGFVVCCFDSLEKIFAGSGDQAWLIRSTHHCITLSRTCLAVCKDTRMISLEVVVQEFFSQAVVDILLVGIVLVGLVMTPERIVKCKRPSPQ